MTDPVKLRRRVRQLERSRQRWKERVASKQQEIRYLRVKSRDLARSRDAWRQRAQAAAADDEVAPAAVLPLGDRRPPASPGLTPLPPEAARPGGA